MLTFEVEKWECNSDTVYVLLDRVYDKNIKYVGPVNTFDFGESCLIDSFSLMCDAGDVVEGDTLDRCNANTVTAISSDGVEKKIQKHTLCKRLLKKRLTKQ